MFVVRACFHGRRSTHKHKPRSMRENSFTSWHRHARHTHKPSSTISFCTIAPPTSLPSMRSVGAVVVVRCLLLMSRKHSRGHDHTHKQSSANDVRRTAHIITLRTAIVRTYDYTPSPKEASIKRGKKNVLRTHSHEIKLLNYWLSRRLSCVAARFCCVAVACLTLLLLLLLLCAVVESSEQQRDGAFDSHSAQARARS